MASGDDGEPATGDDATMAATPHEPAEAGSQDTPAPHDAAPSAEAPLLFGAARYALGRELGRGGMGQVLEADDLQFDRTVAVKRLLPGTRSESRTRFEMEAKVTAGLGHPGVPGVFERGILSDGSPYYAMEKIEGRTLTDVLRDAESPDQRLGLLPALSRVAQTIAYAHDQGVVHRDLKPDNIIIGDFGQAVVLDWGLAKVGRKSVAARVSGGRRSASKAADLSLDGAALGTPAYMAPEQAAGRIDEMDARTDVFGLGAVLYQLLTGAPPFAAKSSLEALTRAAEARYPPIVSLNPTAPRSLIEVCHKAMELRPEHRYASAGEFAAELERFTAQAVSSVGDRIANVASGAVGALSMVGLVVVAALVYSSTGFASSLGPHTAVAFVLTMGGAALSVVEWVTRGRYRLGSMALAVALATGALGVASWSMGLSEMHELLVPGGNEPALVASRLHFAEYLSLRSLAIASYLCALQLLLWGIARRRAVRLRHGARD